MDYSIYFMVFLGVYYTLLDIGELGAEGLMLTIIIEFKLKKALSKKLLKLINESNNIDKITKIAKVASKTTIIKNNKENPDKVMENSIKLLEALDIKL